MARTSKTVTEIKGKPGWRTEVETVVMANGQVRVVTAVVDPDGQLVSSSSTITPKPKKVSPPVDVPNLTEDGEVPEPVLDWGYVWVSDTTYYDVVMRPGFDPSDDRWTENIQWGHDEAYARGLAELRSTEYIIYARQVAVSAPVVVMRPDSD